VVAALHLFKVANASFEFLEKAGVMLLELDVAKSTDLKAKRAAVGLGGVPGDDAVVFQPADPSENGGPTKPGFVAQFLHRCAAIALQRFNQLPIQGVELGFHLFRYAPYKRTMTRQTYLIHLKYETIVLLSNQISTSCPY
jgi:hypothetical protein